MNFWYKNRSLSRNKMFPQVLITSWVRSFDSSCRACPRSPSAGVGLRWRAGIAVFCLFIDEIAIDCFLIDAVSLIRFRVDVWVFGLAGPDASCASSRRRYSMTTAGGRKKQRTLGSFFGAPSETAPSPAAHAPLRTPGSSAHQDAQKAVTAVATQFFAGLWRTSTARPVGAPSADRKERERAVVVLSKVFGVWYCREHQEARSDGKRR